MFVEASEFSYGMTQSQVDDIINALPLTPYEFGKIACLDGRMYNVTTKCQDCGLELNYCVRRELPRILYATQQMTEERLNYAITPRYERAYIPFGYAGKVRLPHRNVEKVNVEPTYTLLDEYENVTVSPYIEENITISEVGGKCIATFSANLIKNPSEAIIRDENGKVYEQQQVSGYPKKSGGNWQVAIMGINSPCDNGLSFHVQHCELIRVSIETPDCAGVVRPVYPSTRQIIPTHRIDTNGNNTTYWFHVWALARPEFMDDGIDFAQGDFYKLYDAIDFMCFGEATKNAIVRVVKSEDCTLVFEPLDTAPAITILDGELGLVYIDTRLFRGVNSNIPLSQCGVGVPQYIEIWYKTNPSVMREPFPITAIKTAMAHYSAYKLPTSACSCTLKEGFIFQAQSYFIRQEVNPFTGGVVTNVEERITNGEREYESLMSSVQSFQEGGKI